MKSLFGTLSGGIEFNGLVADSSQDSLTHPYLARFGLVATWKLLQHCDHHPCHVGNT